MPDTFVQAFLQADFKTSCKKQILALEKGQNTEEAVGENKA